MTEWPKGGPRDALLHQAWPHMLLNHSTSGRRLTVRKDVPRVFSETHSPPAAATPGQTKPGRRDGQPSDPGGYGPSCVAC